MHCPKCGQMLVSDEISFCTGCGLKISDVKELLLPERNEIKKKNSRKMAKGVLQGVGLMLFGFVLVSVLAILRDLNLVPAISIKIATLIFCIGGAAWMGIALILNSNVFGRDNGKTGDNAASQPLLAAISNDKALPTAKDHIPIDFNLQSFTTGELAKSSSVTEYTTRSLGERLEK